MHHLYKIVCPRNFTGWADGACQYHQDKSGCPEYQGHPWRYAQEGTPEKVCQILCGGLSQDPESQDAVA